MMLLGQLVQLQTVKYKLRAHIYGCYCVMSMPCSCIHKP